METKELKIVPPPGYVIDKENSTFECIKFKRKVLCYADIAKELFLDRGIAYYAGPCKGEIASIGINDYSYADSINCVSKKQAEKLLALNKLINVAKYLNGDWKPNFNDGVYKYYVSIRKGKLTVSVTYSIQSVEILFESKELAEQAIEILGEETIRLALSQV